MLGNSRCHKNLLIKKGSCQEAVHLLKLRLTPTTTADNSLLIVTAPALTGRGFFYCLYFQLILLWLSSLLSPDRYQMLTLYTHGTNYAKQNLSRTNFLITETMTVVPQRQNPRYPLSVTYNRSDSIYWSNSEQNDDRVLDYEHA